MKKWFIRGSITFVWLFLFAFTLYAPRWSRFHVDENTLSVFTWGGLIDPEVVQRFERETGHKVHLSFFSSNEELLAKMRATKGKGYDLVLPSDYAVRTLIEEGLLKKLDPLRLRNYSRLHPALLHHPFDPESRFSIPFAWELFGFGVQKDLLESKDFVPSLKLLFTPHNPPLCIGMTNDPLEAISIASLNLFGKVDALTETQAQEVKSLLSKQKQWVEAYNHTRPDLLLTSHQCSLVFSPSSYIERAMRQFSDLAFIPPEEGTFASMEHFCILAATKKEALAYQFIDALLDPESVKAHWNSYALYPVTIDAMDYIECNDRTRAFLSSLNEGFKNWQFYHNLLTDEQQRTLWIQAKVE